MKNQSEPPEGIVLTIGAKMYGDNGYRHWLRNFLHAMARHEKGIFYWIRAAHQPKVDNLQYVYLCIGGKIRYRCYFGGSRDERIIQFMDGREMYGKAWIILSGPVVTPPSPIPMKGFQGFRYTRKLF